MVGDGFGGRLWYSPTKFSVASYSGYYACFDSCSTTTNQLYGWGGNGYYQFGIGTSISGLDQPTPLPNLSDVKYYSGGYYLGVIKNDNTGWVSGPYMYTPTQVISDVKFLDACSYYVSFVKSDGTVWSVGVNVSGSFGDGNLNSSFTSTPVQMQSINNAVRVACNRKALIVLLNDSTLVSVGDNSQGAAGLGYGISETFTPMPIPGLSKIVDIKSISNSSIALSDSGFVYFWGSSPPSIHDYLPVKVTGLDSIIAISGCDDGGHFLALDENGNCYAWRNNNYGQCGIQLPETWITKPRLVATDVIDILAGETFSYIVKEDNSLWATGNSDGGSIWLNLPNFRRRQFTQLDNSIFEDLCTKQELDIITTDCTDSTYGSISVSLDAGQPSYSYSIGDEFQSNGQFNDLNSGNYDITVIAENGCEYYSWAYVGGDNCPEPPIEPPDSLHFPNVFTPNDDGVNDVFYFESNGVTNLTCRIFNRWGKEVAYLEGSDATWDGKTRLGLDCSAGVYYYLVDYEFQNGNKDNHNGYLTLLR